jgi:hypothetical protein
MFEALAGTFKTYGSYYLKNIYLWIKSAVWDAPQRFLLDLQLEQMRINRDLSDEYEEGEIKEY